MTLAAAGVERHGDGGVAERAGETGSSIPSRTGTDGGRGMVATQSDDRSPDAARPPAVAKAVAAAAAALQLAAVGAVLVLGTWSGSGVGDRLGAVPGAIVYGLPGILALLALRARGPLLMAAAVTSLVLAVFPFSLHSFVFWPVGIIYLAAYTRWPRRHDRSRSAAAAVVVPTLVLAAFLVLVVHDDPICYTKDASGQVTVDRDPDPVTSGTQTIEAGSDVVERGCSSDTVVWWEAAASLALSATALTAGVALVRPFPREELR